MPLYEVLAMEEIAMEPGIGMDEEAVGRTAMVLATSQGWDAFWCNNALGSSCQ